MSYEYSDEIIKRVDKIYDNIENENDGTMTIAFGCDKNYIRVLGTSISTVLEHNDNVAIYVFLDDISDNDRERLTRTFALRGGTRASCTLCYVDSSIFSNFPLMPNFTFATYLRLIIGRYFYKKSRYILYMDGDIVCCRSLEPLFSIDFDDKSIGAVYDITHMNKIKRSDEHEMKYLNKIGFHGDGYFNAGVLLIDTEQWHDMKIFERSMECISENPEKWSENQDQDVLNYLFQNKVYWLEDKYNKHANKKNSYADDVAMVHYISWPKPWTAYYECDNPPDLFQEALRKSEWKDIPLDLPRSRIQYRFMSRACFNRGEYIEAIKWQLFYLRRKLLGMK